jgi:hypothetical protein
MTDYTDVPKANQLYAESERTQAAVTNIDNGGVLSSFTIGSPPPPPLTDAPPPVATAPLMPIMITPDVSSPPSAALMADIRAYLVTRQDDLNNQLAALEVSNTPPPIPPPGRKVIR